MSNAYNIALYFHNQNKGQLGRDIFINRIPESGEGINVSDAIIAVFDSPGTPSNFAMKSGTKGVVFNHQTVQIRVRDHDPENGSNRINDLHLLLNGLHGETINNVEYLHITADSLPFLMMRDDRDRAHFACNFTVDTRA